MAKKALIIDDSVTIRGMIGVAFKHMDWEAVAAGNADAALQMLDQHKDEFDIIITDINMPGMNGIELTREIKKRPGSKNTPVLVVSTEGGDDIKRQGKEAGASGWIVKPLKPEVLKAAVSKLCNLSG